MKTFYVLVTGIARSAIGVLARVYAVGFLRCAPSLLSNSCGFNSEEELGGSSYASEMKAEIHQENCPDVLSYGALQGGIAQMRFQPRVGRLLAAAAENKVTIFDVESETVIQTLQACYPLATFQICLVLCVAFVY